MVDAGAAVTAIVTGSGVDCDKVADVGFATDMLEFLPKLMEKIKEINV